MDELGPNGPMADNCPEMFLWDSIARYCWYVVACRETRSNLASSSFMLFIFFGGGGGLRDTGGPFH